VLRTSSGPTVLLVLHGAVRAIILCTRYHSGFSCVNCIYIFVAMSRVVDMLYEAVKLCSPSSDMTTTYRRGGFIRPKMQEANIKPF